MDIIVHPVFKYIVINDCKSNLYFLQIINKQGVQIYNGHLKPKNGSIKIKGLKNGSYTIFITDEESKSVKKIKI